MRARGVAVVVAYIAFAKTAYASPSAKLVYVRGAGAETCPDESELRKAVAVRIGYDPFFPVAQKTVIAQVARSTKGYRAHVQIVAQDGTVRGERDLATTGDDCNELVGATALAISVALDDLDDPTEAPPPSEPAPTEPPPPTSPASASASTPRDEPPRRPPPAPPNEPATRTELSGAVGVGAVVGTAPSFAGSVNLAFALARGALALRLDGRGDAPSGTGLRPIGRLSTSSYVGIASICLRGSIPFACAGGGGGYFRSSTEGLAVPRSDGAIIAIAALRAGAIVRASKSVFVEPSVVLGANLVRHDVEVDGSKAYELPFLWGGASLLVGFDFF